MKLALATALIATLAAPVFANTGDGIAATRGLNAADYTTNELLALQHAAQEENWAFIEAKTGGASVEADVMSFAPVSVGSNPIADSIASRLGVDAADYSVSELIFLEQQARERS